MICESCGAALVEKATFCPSCGTLVKKDVKAVLAPLPGQVTPIIPEAEESKESEFPSDDFAENEMSPDDFKEETTAPTEQPPQNVPVQKDNSWAGTVSLVMGIISICSLGSASLCVILAVIFGVAGKKSKKRKSAVAGIVLAIVSVVLFALLIAAIVTGLMPSEFYYVYNGIANLKYI